ncbi:LOW QUALITY PROTEIN: Pkinase_Tyr domain-containing protein, partial [Cephalotus follicularis]
NTVNVARHQLLQQQSGNLVAAPVSVGSPSAQIIALPTTRNSGAFPAVQNGKKKPSRAPASLPSLADPSLEAPQTPKSQADDNSRNIWNNFFIIPIVSIFLIVVAAIFFMFRKGVTTIGPWKTGLSGQLQKAFVTGVPKLNHPELETACEDFSNIIDTFDVCTIYKGTLSSGVEIAVASTSIISLKEWSNDSEMAHWKKIDMLSRVNHQNFVYLIGFCEEDEPFNRMMVFEYAPNGTFYEHLPMEEMEHLDWNARMRVIIGTAYCFQYMHHDLNPPVAHSNLNSTTIYLTDDYAAKIAEICFGSESSPKSKFSGEDEVGHSQLLPSLTTNVYNFGILLLEVISGKLPFLEEQGPLVKCVDMHSYFIFWNFITYVIGPTLKFFKNNELDVICEVIQDCIEPDPRQRPTMKEVTSKLKEVINITPDQATPRLSPLWWAELEILSAAAT